MKRFAELKLSADTARTPIHGFPQGSGQRARAHAFPARGLTAGLVLGLTALFTGTAQAQTTVPTNWALNPAGLGPGDSFRLLFITSSAHRRTAQSADIASYNTTVQTAATGGHAAIQAYAAGFRVVGCTTAVDARDNTSTTGPGVPIYWLNGPKVADDYADFYDNTWDNESNADDRDEDGVNSVDTSSVFAFGQPHTGCDDDGTEKFSGGDSRALGEPQVMVGQPGTNPANRGPIDGFRSNARASERLLYGLSAVFTIANPPPEPTEPTETTETTETTVPPDAPVDMQATVDGTMVMLSWSNPQDSSITHYQYRLKREDQEPERWRRLVDSNADTTSATIDLTTSEAQEGSANEADQTVQWTIWLRAVSGGTPGFASRTFVSAPVVPVPAVPAVWLGVGAVLLVLARRRRAGRNIRPYPDSSGRSGIR